MKNIFPNAKKELSIKFKMPSSVAESTTGIQLSFNGMHTMYENHNAASLFSAFTKDIVRKNMPVNR